MALADTLLQLTDRAAFAGKHGGFVLERAGLALKAAGEAVALLGADEAKGRLLVSAIAGCNRAMADATDAAAAAAAGSELLEAAAPVAAGAEPKGAAAAWLAARARYDDAAACFANVDAGAGNTGDWLTLVLTASDLTPDAKAKVQTALDAIVEMRRFSRAGASAAIQVRTTVDEGLPLLEVELPPPPVELSTLSVHAVAASVLEGDPGEPAQAVSFLVSREGPVDQACSVTWTKSGTSGATDFVAGVDFSGSIAWASGDDGAKQIEFLLASDVTVEPTDTVVVTLSDPVGAKLGDAAAAETAIVNDDEEQPPPGPPPSNGKYDEKLPYGGLGIGTASLLGQPGNQKVYTQSSIMILCERSGTVDRLCWQNRINGHGRTGYSDGDGGIIDWIVRVVPDPKAGTIKPGPILGQTRRISAAATTKGWTAEYQAAGGKGSTPVKFVEIPTIRFQQPFKVQRGDMLLFTQQQHGNGAVSINNNYSTCRSFSDWSPYPYHASCRQFKGASLATRRPEHFPLILIGYADGVVKGTGVMGYAAGLSQAQESIELGGSTRARQVFVCPSWAAGKVIRRVVSFWGRTTKEVNGSLRCRIRLAGASPGSAKDEGQALADSTLLASRIAYRPDIKNDSPAPLIRHEFTNPAKLVAGKTYYVVMEVVGGSTKYRGARCVRWLDQLPIGLKNADWALKGMEGQRDTGGGWKSLAVSNVVQDVPVWCEF